jgi:hypothetical protein
VKDLKKVSRDDVEGYGTWCRKFSTSVNAAFEILHCVQDDRRK